MRVIDSRSAAARFVALIVGLTALVVGTTVLAAYLFTSPSRGYVFWCAIQLLCCVEFTGGLLVVNLFARKRCRYQPSTPAVVSSWTLLLAYLVIGMVLIVTYGAIRTSDESKDVKLAALFMILTVVLFVLAALIYGVDLLFVEREEGISQKRAEFKAQSFTVRSAMQELRQLELKEPSQMACVDRWMKRLQGIETALAHAHGGGAGSPEAGRMPFDVQAEQRVAEAVANVVNQAHQVQEGPIQEFDQRGLALERAIGGIEACLASLQMA